MRTSRTLGILSWQYYLNWVVSDFKLATQRAGISRPWNPWQGIPCTSYGDAWLRFMASFECPCSQAVLRFVRRWWVVGGCDKLNAVDPWLSWQIRRWNIQGSLRCDLSVYCLAKVAWSNHLNQLIFCTVISWIAIVLPFPGEWIVV